MVWEGTEIRYTENNRFFLNFYFILNNNILMKRTPQIHEHCYLIVNICRGTPVDHSWFCNLSSSLHGAITSIIEIVQISRYHDIIGKSNCQGRNMITYFYYVYVCEKSFSRRFGLVALMKTQVKEVNCASFEQ